METLTTTVTNYSFDLSDADQAAEYERLCRKLERLKLKKLAAYPNRAEARGPKAGSPWPVSGALELEAEYLFLDQWNTACGNRVFDWFEVAFPNWRIKSGYWLAQTPAMREIRRNTLRCGFCGHQELATKGHVFCEECLDHECLKEPNLHLTRLLPLAQGFDAIGSSLTDAEAAWLMPQYIERQAAGATSRNAAKLRKQREDVITTLNEAKRCARERAAGLLWLMDHEISIDNVIYYDHTETFRFGWRSPYSPAVVSRLLEKLSEFNFAYEIVGEDKIYQGNRRANHD